MQRVFSATRRANIELALDRNTKIYDKSRLPECPHREIYVWLGEDINDCKEGLFFEALTDLIDGYKMAVISGLVPESQIKPDETTIASKIGTTLEVDQVYRLTTNEGGVELEDITQQVFQ